jgi:Zn-dependent protease with chaperone function
MKKNTYQLYLVILILPLCLFVASLYESYRISAYVYGPEQLVQAQQELQTMRDKLTTMENALKKNPSRSAYEISVFNKRIVDKEKSIKNRTGWITKKLTHGAGNLAALLAMLASLVGIAIVVLTAKWKSTALKTRDALLAAFESSQRIMPKLLTLFLLLSAAAVTAFAALEVMALFLPVPPFLLGRENTKLFMLYLILVALVVLFAFSMACFGLNSMLQLNRAYQHAAEPSEVAGELLSHTNAPALWRLVEEVAQKLSAPMPKNIILGIEDGFYVTEGKIQLEPSKQTLSGQTLFLSALRMSVLSPVEIMSIIGHELGHFVGEDTAYSRRFSPLYGKAVRTNYILFEQKAKLAIVLNDSVLDTFDLAILHWSRVREFGADQSGKHIGGGVPAAAALLRLGATSPVLDAHVLDLQRNASTDNAVARLLSAASTTPLADVHDELKKAIPHPTDTHPPIQERAKRLALEELDAAFTLASRPVDEAGVRWLREMVGNFDGIYQSLASHYASTVKAQIESYKADLREVVANADALGTTVVYQRLSWMWFILPSISALSAAVFAQRWIVLQTTNLLLMLLGSLGVTLALLALPWLVRKLRTSKPFVTLTPSGIESPSFKRPLAWSEIVDYDIIENEVNGATIVMVSLKLSPLIVFGLVNSNGLRYKYKTNKKNKPFILQLSYTGSLKKMKNEVFFNLIHSYFNAGHAKAQLAHMEK